MPTNFSKAAIPFIALSCTIFAYAAWAVAQSAGGNSHKDAAIGGQPPIHNLKIAVLDLNGVILSNSTVVARDSSGETKADVLSDGMHFVTAEGYQTKLQISHPVLGDAVVGLTIPSDHPPGRELLVNVQYVAPGVATLWLSGSETGAVFTKPILPATLSGAGEGSGNNLCVDRVPIFDGLHAYSTIGATTDGAPNPGCQFNTQTWADIWYNYIATCDGNLTVSTCNDGNPATGDADYDTDIVIYDGCACPATALLGCNDDAAGCAGFTSSVTVPVVSGNCYKIRVGGWNSDADQGTGTLAVVCEAAGGGGFPECNAGAGDCCSSNGSPGCDEPDCCNAICDADPFCCDVTWDGICAAAAELECEACFPEPCDLDCPPGATPEFEFNCGLPVDVVNGGCNSDPPVFSSISCGQTVCGTSAFDGATRDTDWWEITIATPQVITWTVTAEFDVLTFILAADPCPAAIISDAGLAGPCETVSITSECLDAGTYVLFVAPQFTNIFACSEGLKYFGTVTCVDCAPPEGPENDDCVDRLPIFNGETAFDTSNASTDGPAHPECQFDGQTYHDIWYNYNSTFNGDLTVSTCNRADYDTDLVVYDGCDCGALNLLACNDDFGGCAGFTSEVTVTVIAGNCYKIRVGGFQDGDEGTGLLNIVKDIATGNCCLPNFTCLDDVTEADCLAQGGVFEAFGVCEQHVFVITGCENAFEDISGTGTELFLADDGGQVVGIGFTFGFFKDLHTEIAVCSNGYLTFGGDLSDFTNDQIPDDIDPNDYIAPFWDDLDPANAGSPATIHYQTLGDPGQQRFIAQWTDVPEFPNSGANTFQAILFERSNCIEFRYGDFTADVSGTDVTIGVENQDGSDGFQVDASTITPGSCVSLCPEQLIRCPEGEPGGCTPGYWKQPHHFDSWPDQFDPNKSGTQFSDVFEDAFPGKSLSQVLGQGGNQFGLNALGRHTVAALLNAATLDYGLSVGEVVDLFNDVFPGTKSSYNDLKDLFEDLNEQGCPLN